MVVSGFGVKTPKWQCVALPKDVLYSLLLDCRTTRDSASIWRVFSHVVNSGLDSTAYLGDHVIRAFTSCGSLTGAIQVFSKLSQRTVYTWHAIISAYCKLGAPAKGLNMLNHMLDDGIQPDIFVFACFLSACGAVRSLHRARLIHHYMIYTGLKPDTVLGNSLLDAYAKCGGISDAYCVLMGLQHRDIVSWGTVLVGCVNHGQNFNALELYQNMKQDAVKPDKVVYLGLLKASANLFSESCGFHLHDELVRDGFDIDVVLGSSMIDMYAKCNKIREALSVFETLSHPNLVCWGAIISGLAEFEHGDLALELYERMQKQGIQPDKVILLGVLKACLGHGAVTIGRLIHTQILEYELESDEVIGSMLTDMYAKCFSIEDAQSVFDGISGPDSVAWGIIIAGYTHNKQAAMALTHFWKMQQLGVYPGISTFYSTLKACVPLGEIHTGMTLHGQIIEYGYETDEAVTGSLVDMYAKLGHLEECQKILDEMPKVNAVSCCAMIAGYADHGHGIPALNLLEKMDVSEIEADNITHVYMLKACGSSGLLTDGRRIHHRILWSGLGLDTMLGNTLIEMYLKCWNLEDAHHIFEAMPCHDIVSWSIMIGGFAQFGHCHTADIYLKKMQNSGLQPNETIFTSVLAACGHHGLLNQACHYYTLMREEYNILPSIEHYSSMINLLGRTGHFIEAGDMIETMPTVPNVIVWTAMLANCKAHANALLGQECFNHYVVTDPDDASGYALISETYLNGDILLDAEENCIISSS